MAKKYLVNLDLNKNQLLNALVQNIGTDPVDGVAGQIIFNTTDKVFKYHNGTKWVKLDVSKEDLSNVTMTGESIVDAINGQSAKSIQAAKVSGIHTIAQDKADVALQQAKSYADRIKTDLLNSASNDYDTFKEIEDAIKRNASALSAISNVAKKYTTQIGDGIALSHTVTHNLNTEDVIVQAYDTVSKEQVMVDVVITNANTVTISTAVAIKSNAKLKIVVIG